MKMRHRDVDGQGHKKTAKKDVEGQGQKMLPEKALKGPDRCKRATFRTGPRG